MNRNIRYGIASHVNTPEYILDILSHDEDCSVRCAVAGNSSSSEESLDRLSMDDHSWVVDAVAKNSATPETTIERLGRQDSMSIVARSVYAKEERLESLAMSQTQRFAELLLKTPELQKPPLQSWPAILPGLSATPLQPILLRKTAVYKACCSIQTH